MVSTSSSNRAGRLASSNDAIAPPVMARASLRQVAHDLDQVALALEADAREFWHDDEAVLDPNSAKAACSAKSRGSPTTSYKKSG
jgi:hypothetical protein